MGDGGKGDKRRPEDTQAFEEGYGRVFGGDKKPSRGRWIWDKETRQFVPYEEYVQPIDANAPMVMPDIQPYKSQIDGSMISSRSTHRTHLRDHGCIEVGDQVHHLKPYGNYKPKGVKEDLIRAYHQVRDRNR